MVKIAMIGAGAMGSAVGGRLVEGGAEVVTYLEGRSEETIARARASGMVPVGLAGLADAELVLSIVPPSTATAVAQSMVEVLSNSSTKPAYVDFNAISPATMKEVAAILDKTGCKVLDGSIIGSPPSKGGSGPSFYVSGDRDGRTEALAALQLDIRRIEGGIGAASALKMVYAGISKGMIGLGAAMMAAAGQSHAAASLQAEMSGSMPDVQGRLRRSIPTMYPKAYRWVGEMLEIAEFLGPTNPAAQVFEGMAGIFATFADDFKGSKELIATVDAALRADP